MNWAVSLQFYEFVVAGNQTPAVILDVVERHSSRPILPSERALLVAVRFAALPLTFENIRSFPFETLSLYVCVSSCKSTR